MALAPGTRLGSYEVLASIGAGGMGEVYRARDSRLGRDVALKVLPELFTTDPERRARFEREAKVLASLNHPNIAQVYDAGTSGAAFIAMELVEGQTLDEIIKETRGLTLERALAIVRQIAAALEAAHDTGVVHRDLKPANVKVRDDGTVKVLDFGLAKAFAADAESAAGQISNSPTLTARATQLGMILGTAAYMAPEQAKGRSVDRRADVWAFGVVFFEMLAGRRAFEGEDVSDVLASVLKSEPEWSALPPGVPAPVRRLLRRCLEKDPKRRLRDVAEGLLQMDDGLAAGSAEASHSEREAVPKRSALSLAAPVAITALVTAVGVYGISRWTGQAPPPPALDPVRFSVDTPTPLGVSPTRRDLAISTDGKVVVYSAVPTPGGSTPALWARRLDQAETLQIRGATGATGPVISPDGQWVAYIPTEDPTALKKVSILGGPPVPVCKVNTTIMGAAWLQEDTLILGIGGDGLHRVSAAGGTPERLTEPDRAKSREESHIWPSAIHGTDLIVFTITAGGAQPSVSGKLAVLDRSTGRITRLDVQGTSARYVHSGHLIYGVRDGSLRAVRFDPRTTSVSGSPTPVLEGLGVKSSGAANYDVSSDGRFVFAPGAGVLIADRTIVWTSRNGTESVIPSVPLRNYYYARLSPDGSRISLDIRDQDEDVWIWDINRSHLARVTKRTGADQYGLWVDNDRLIVSSVMTGSTDLFLERSDGIGQPKQLTNSLADKQIPFPNAVTRDGKSVIFRTPVGSKNDLFLVDIDGGQKPRPLLATEYDEKNAEVSPDGTLLAFESDLSGKPEVYIRSFPDVERRQWPVSTSGGSKPAWSRDGRELFYVSTDRHLMAVPVRKSAAGVDVLKPVQLFSIAPYFSGGQGRNYDVSLDGKRFVMVKNATTGAATTTPINVVINWVDELRSKLK